MVNPLRVTFYKRTGYSMSDEPASESVINQNEHFDMGKNLVEYNASNRSQQAIKVEASDDDLLLIDYVKFTDVITGERWYYYVTGWKRINDAVVYLQLLMDAFATSGLDNIRFFGNVVRRSLSRSEASQYPILPEPWAPRRPLKMRRIVIDVNTNKVAKLPSHISINFEEEASVFEKTEKIDVPTSVLGLSTFEDSLAVSATLPMGYARPATDTTHTINTPWGAIDYVTPFEQYYTLAGQALVSFLANSKKYNSLDLVTPPYYVPNPGQTVSVRINELSNSNTRNPKASRYYTTITIRSLASGASRTFSEQDTILQYDQPLAVMIAPDKMGGMYLLPTTIRDTGLTAYTYLEGVYSPFETVVYNAVGDTPAKFAADGTILMNQALNTLFETYIQKINALQMQGMQAKYIKDLGSVKSVVMAFAATFFGAPSETITTSESFEQTTESRTVNSPVVQTSTQSQFIPSHVQTQSSLSDGSSGTSRTSMPVVRSYNRNGTINNIQARGSASAGTYAYVTTSSDSDGWSESPAHTTTTTNPGGNSSLTGQVTIPNQTIEMSSISNTGETTQTGTQTTRVPVQVTRAVTTQGNAERTVAEGNQTAVNGIPTIYESTAPDLSASLDWDVFQTLLFGSYRNEVHSFMLGNINDYLNRWASIQNDLHNGKVANLFKNITLVGNYSDANKLAGKYEIIVASIQPEDEYNFDMYLDHFGHAVDEYSDQLVRDVGRNYTYTMVGEDAILSNTVRQASSQQILNQFRTGVRVWKTLIRPENF